MTNTRQSLIEQWLHVLTANGGAECEDVPEIFFPEDYPDKHTREYAIRTAKTICAACPIRLECFAYAVEAKEPFGIWAGTLPHER